MKNLFKHKNNKGFTLVELIVVIAVLAVITVIAIPQFTGYIEKSKQGTDRNAAKEVAHAVEVAYASIKLENPEDKMLKMIIHDDGHVEYTEVSDDWEESGVSLAEEGTGSALVEEVSKIIPPNSYVYKSKLYIGHEIVYIANVNDGTVEISAEYYLDENLRYQTFLDGQITIAQGTEAAAEAAFNVIDDTMDGVRELAKDVDDIVNNADAIIARDAAQYQAAVKQRTITHPLCGVSLWGPQQPLCSTCQEAEDFLDNSDYVKALVYTEEKEKEDGTKSRNGNYTEAANGVKGPLLQQVENFEKSDEYLAAKNAWDEAKTGLQEWKDKKTETLNQYKEAEADIRELHAHLNQY